MARNLRPAGSLVGNRDRRIRTEHGLSQPALATRCQRLVWDIGRDIVARIEAKILLVPDSELLFLASALDVHLERLFSSAALTAPKRKSLDGA